MGDLEVTRVGYGAMQLAGPGVFGPPKDRQAAVAVLHGAGGTGRKMEAYSGLNAVSDREGFAVVYPSALAPRPFWNYTEDPKKADVGWSDALIWAVISGTGTALGKLLTSKGAAGTWRADWARG